MGVSITPPPPGQECKHLVVWGPNGPLPAPRPCRRWPVVGSDYCRRHQQLAERYAIVEIRDGGYCVWCGQPGRSYTVDRVTIPLCVRHGLSLSRAIREGR